MKIRIADIPANVLNGLEKHGYTSLFLAGVVIGWSTSALYTHSFGSLMIGCGIGVATLVAAWFAGKP